MARAAETSVYRTLLRWLLVPLLGLLLLDAGVGYWTAQRSADLAHDRSLHELAREVALHVHPGPQGPQLVLSPEAERLLLWDAEDRIAYRVSTPEGHMLGGDASLSAPQPLPPAGGRPRYYRDTLAGEPVRVVAAWLPAGEDPRAAPVLVQVAETRHQRDAMVRDILAQTILPQLLLIAGVLVAVWWGVRQGLGPLTHLREALMQRSHRDLQPLAREQVPQEVLPLVESVNDLMQRLGQALEARNRFIADAAHQLKTPVIELALRESDPQRLQRSMAQLYVGVDRLSRLVRQLLSLARNEPDAAESLRLQPVDLAALALEVSMEWVPQALRREIDLGLDESPGPVMIQADIERLRELINNLIDNAVRYSCEGGRVTVSAIRAPDGQACLSVSDDGPHIPPEERSRIFERFHRLLGNQADGSGLGLAIVSEIAALHGARITLDEDTDGVGNTFRVWFPAG